jgi:magnesium transporter
VALHILVHRPSLGVSTLSTVDEAREALKDPENVLWVDFDCRSAESDALLSHLFGFHPLAIEDVYKEGHHPKVEDYDRYLYVVVQALTREKGWDLADIGITEVDLFIGGNFVVTHHAGALPAIDCIREPTLARGKNHMQKGATFLAHAILDAIVDRFVPLGLELEHEIDALEVRVLRGTDESVLARILELIRSLHHMRRYAIRQRELLERLARAEFDEIPQEAKPFFRDVHEHFKDFTESLEIVRDDLASLFNAFISLASQRLNEVMKLLTILSAIVLPPTLIAGVYGMNFKKWFPELEWEYGYLWALGLMVASIIGGVGYCRYRRWL